VLRDRDSQDSGHGERQTYLIRCCWGFYEKQNLFFSSICFHRFGKKSYAVIHVHRGTGECSTSVDTLWHVEHLDPEHRAEQPGRPLGLLSTIIRIISSFAFRCYLSL
jgi:hypothetical protein